MQLGVDEQSSMQSANVYLLPFVEMTSAASMVVWQSTVKSNPYRDRTMGLSTSGQRNACEPHAMPVAESR